MKRENVTARALRNLKSQRGMTLIEIMIVIVILGLIIGAITFGVMPRFKKAKKKTTQLKLNNIASILTESAEEPEHSGKEGNQILEALVTDGTIKKSDLKDAWGQEVKAEKAGEGFCVRSAGPDKSFNTADDVLSNDCNEN
ncbi:MAG: prepilin-type N-terminal cleavage/methylation domain-containing protein [Deltaproteobacteria bacterium]|nr:prepilin-type N-terminal cleavage/methylation domain-containing protein [Deltaproteobacteria bacterium]